MSQMERLTFQSKYCFWIKVCTLPLALPLSLSVLLSLCLSVFLCPCLSQSFSLALPTSLPSPPSAVFYQILSQGASYKTNRAHQDRAPEEQLSQASLIWAGPGLVKARAGIHQAYQIWSANLKSVSRLILYEKDCQKHLSIGPRSVLLH